MTSPILFAGGEDINFNTATGWLTSASAPSTTIDTTSGRFRAGYARYGLALNWSNNAAAPLFFIPLGLYTTSSSFWLSYRVFATALWSGFSNGFIVHTWYDTAGLPRLRLKTNSSTYTVVTVNTAGTEVQIGSSWAILAPIATQISKVDFFINYAVSGQFSVYMNGAQVFNFTGDITTNSVTSLGSKIDFSAWNVATNQNGAFVYSEVIVSTRDTRNMSLVTQAPTANGNTHNWDTGTATNAAQNSVTTAQTNPQTATTSGLIQEYQVTPAIPSGTFSVISVVQTAQATIGTSGPTKFDFMVRTGATDYTSPDVSPTSAWALYLYQWDTNPNTTAAWLTTDLPASSTSYNMGLKSVA